MRSRALLLSVLALVACSSAPNPSGVLHSETASGPFLLSVELPKSTWSAGEQIVGQATLQLTQGDARELTASGSGVIAFSYSEVSGRRHMDADWTADCGPHPISVSSPIGTMLKKSGGTGPDDPDYDFYMSFLRGPYVALPEGTWDITAVAHFVDGAVCFGGSGRSYQMQTSVRVTITP
jgi:hypothetical protein